MLTAKREITTEEERYGGYSTNGFKHFGASRPSSATYYREYDMSDEFTDELYDEDYDRGIMRKPHTAAEHTETEIPRYSIDVDEELLRPSSETMRALDSDVKSVARVDSSSRVETKQKIKLNARGKSLIAIYAAVFLALVIIVIVNAVAISSLSASIGGLETQLNSAASEYGMKNAELDEVSYPGADSIPNNFVKVGSEDKVSISLPAVAETETAVKNSNWFDAFCEFFSGMFGG